MLDSTIPLPRTTVALVEKVPIAARHPGLQLDKVIRPAANQQDQKQSLEGACQTTGDDALLRSLAGRRRAHLEMLAARVWTCTTAGLLTLHLARASALENAGICLHPVYGFAYLPATGLKGMARAYAETVWFPAQYKADAEGRPADDEQQRQAESAWRKIEAVFGWAPHSDDGKSWKPRGIRRHESDDAAAAGEIVFHDAWPERWPRLQLDIVNNHHGEYYQNERAAPGDWESPSLVSFLAIGPGEAFCFALSRRTGEASAEWLELAEQWLTAALVQEGAGAKTAAGYGSFRLDEGEPRLLSSPGRAKWETTLELVTPAFLAGAEQQAHDCDLRPATLRGLLRWWWRTMHAGFVDAATLHRLEAVVWGDVNTGGPVRVSVEPVEALRPERYEVKDGFRPKPDFKRRHGLQDPLNGKTTQGLFYASYGMADGKSLRHYLPRGTRWQVRFIARQAFCGDPEKSGKSREVAIPASVILQQAQAALSLLCHFGGVGSKARKGFGAFADLETSTEALLAHCRQAAQAFRKACGCDGAFSPRWAESSTLEQMLPLLEIATPWADEWFALDQVGFAAQAFAQRYAHKPCKAALGLPRKIHGPRDRPIGHQTQASHRRPQTLRGPKGDRHASPVHYHWAKGADGNLVLRVVTFPSPYLPSLAESQRLLGELLEHLRGDVEQRCERYRTAPRPEPQRGGRAATQGAASSAAPHGPPPPQPGARSECILLEEKTKKGGWKAKLAHQDLEGPIVNTADVPADKHAGDRVTLIVASISAGNQQASFRWPTAADDRPPRNPAPRRR